MPAPDAHLAVLREYLRIAVYAGDMKLLPMRARIRETGAHQVKDDGNKVDWVTAADHASKEYISANLSRLFPNVSRIEEEDGRLILQPDVGDVADPLDGTMLYSGALEDILVNARNPDHALVTAENERLGLRPRHSDFSKYGVHLTRIEEGEAVVDCAYFPERELLCWAVKGQGAYLQQADAPAIRLRIADPLAIIGIGHVRPVLTERYQRDYAAVIDAFDKIGGERRFAFTSAVFEACATTMPSQMADATGLYVHSQIYFWDLPELIVREAGGTAVMMTAEGGKLNVRQFSPREFRLFDPTSDAFKRPYAIAVGHPRMVDAFVRQVA